MQARFGSILVSKYSCCYALVSWVMKSITAEEVRITYNERPSSECYDDRLVDHLAKIGISNWCSRLIPLERLLLITKAIFKLRTGL